MAVEVPRRAYLVCATQRSGSTLLCELLSQTGVAGHPREYFEAERDTGIPPHPGRFLEGLPRTGAGVRSDPTPPAAPAYSSLDGVADYREHLERTLRAATTDNGVFAAKLMFNQIAELHALAGALPEYAGLGEDELLDRLFGDATHVWVFRRDKVRQAVSMWKAMQTRLWRAGDEGARDTEPEYRYNAIDHLVRRFEASDMGWRAHFRRRGITPLAIGYETDLQADPGAAVRAVLGAIGEPPPAGWTPSAPMQRQSDSGSEEWVRRYHRDRAEHGPAAPLSAHPS